MEPMGCGRTLRSVADPHTDDGVFLREKLLELLRVSGGALLRANHLDGCLREVPEVLDSVDVVHLPFDEHRHQRSLIRVLHLHLLGKRTERRLCLHTRGKDREQQGENDSDEHRYLLKVTLE